MKILLINGSPKGQNSNTLKLTRAFLDGIKEKEIREFDIASKKINGCLGCFSCWNKTPGKCVINDDMEYVIESEIWADVIIWSFPLYYFGVPGQLKKLIDRQLPMNLPFMIDRNDGRGNGSHPTRYDMSKKRHVIISTCGFYTAENNYDSVKMMFEHFLDVDSIEMITCGQGELFRVKELSTQTNAYLALVKEAGKEFDNGKISHKIMEKLAKSILPKEIFEKMADASWGITNPHMKDDESFIFTSQMASLYNPNTYEGVKIVIEMRYIDRNVSYQIVLDESESKVLESSSLTPNMTIETPFEVWKSISQGKIRGDEALMKGMYKISGDLNIMMNWSKYFNGSTH